MWYDLCQLLLGDCLFCEIIKTMVKPYKSDVRKLLFGMLNSFAHRKQQQESMILQKRQCIQEIECLAGAISQELKPHLQAALQKLKDLEETSFTEQQHIKNISDMSGVSERTLRTIKKEGQSNQGIWRTPGKKRKSRATKINIDNFDQCAIRNKINEFYLVKKEVPTLKKLLLELRQDIQFDGSRETLRKILLNMGYEFKKNTEERTVLMEKYDVAAWRHRYIRKILSVRNEPSETQKPIVYIDETYVHLNYKPKQSWQGPSTSKMVESISKGKRFIIVHAGNENGFVDNALLVFSSKSKNEDYHDDMNTENFSKWVNEKLLPNLESPSVIVLDNASYHSIQINKVPNTSSRKQVIRNWLTENNIEWSDELTKAELLCLVKRHKPEPVYYIDELLKQHGHEVCRLPPYHCHLNPIEMVWSQVKRKVAEKNVMKCTTQEMIKKIEEAFSTVIAEHWTKYVDHVKKLELDHQEKDRLLDDDTIPFIINVQDSASDDDESDYEDEPIFEDIEFLESDIDEDI